MAKRSPYKDEDQKRRIERIVAVPKEQVRLAKAKRRQRIFDNGTIAAAVMILGALLALVVANTDAYQAVSNTMHQDMAFTVLGFRASFSFEYFVNDFLMAIFFLLVGIELKYEFSVGQLKNPRQALLPIIAALGGVCVPALIYVCFNVMQHTGELQGWAIPMATDIAFALGVISLLGERISPATKVFFSTLAIADDIIAIVVIALFYGSSLQISWLLLALVFVLILFLLSKLQVYSCMPYIVVGLALWLCVFLSGVHATIAGVILACFLPARSSIKVAELSDWMQARAGELADDYNGDKAVLSQHDFLEKIQDTNHIMHRVVPPLERVGSSIATPVHFVILPLFAFVNAQVRFVGADLSVLLTSTVTLGALLGAVLGKPIGIVASTMIAQKCGIARLPQGMNFVQLVGVGILGGLGFTMSILIATMAFSDPSLVIAAKVAILLGSLITSFIGISFLVIATKRKRA